MKSIAKLLLGCAVVAAIALPASAQIGLSLSPTSYSVGVGGTETYNLNISGLFGSADYTGPALGAFNVTLDYNASIAFATSVTFGNSLGTDLLNVSGNAITTSDLTTPGQIFLLEGSGDSVAALESQQSKSFTIATITLQGVAPGTTPLTFDLTGTSLSDANSNTLVLNTTTNASLTVIPEPSVTASVFGFAAMGFCMLRRRFSRVASSIS
jgi:hypothetical protein